VRGEDNHDSESERRRGVGTVFEKEDKRSMFYFSSEKCLCHSF